MWLQFQVNKITSEDSTVYCHSTDIISVEVTDLHGRLWITLTENRQYIIDNPEYITNFMNVFDNVLKNSNK